MNLIEETIGNTLIDGLSLLDLAYLSHDPEYGTWSGESLNNIEAALSKAAKSLSKQQLIEEYNELAAQYECDYLTDWDYNTHQIELEMFIDEVYQKCIFQYSKYTRAMPGTHKRLHWTKGACFLGGLAISLTFN